MTDLSQMETQVFEALNSGKQTSTSIEQLTRLNTMTVRACLTSLERKKLIAHTVNDLFVYYYQARAIQRPEVKQTIQKVVIAEPRKADAPVVSQLATRTVSKITKRRARRQKRAFGMSPAQVEIYEKLDREMTIDEIVAAAGRSESSIKTHIHSMIHKGAIQSRNVIGQGCRKVYSRKPIVPESAAGATIFPSPVPKTPSLTVLTSMTPEQALKSVLDFMHNNQLDEVLIVGSYGNGTLLIRSSMTDHMAALWLLKQAECFTLTQVLKEAS